MARIADQSDERLERETDNWIVRGVHLGIRQCEIVRAVAAEPRPQP